MRIALFSSTLDVTNGYGNITYEFCRALSNQGIDFSLFLPRDEAARVTHAEPRWSVHYELPRYIFRFKPHSLFQYLRTVDVSRYDLVHSLLDFPYCFMAARAAKRYRKPFLMGTQGTYGVLPLTFWPEKYFLLWSYLQAKTIIVPSQFTREKILFHTRHAFPIRVIHNGVHFSRFQEKRALSELATYAGKKVLLTVGGLKTRKGQDMVIRALPSICFKHPEVMYVLVGDGEKEYLERLAERMGVDRHVAIVGSRRGDDLVAYFQRADIYVHTPRVVNDLLFEGFGIVYLEASACRKPIVATDAGGVRDAILDGETGVIVPDGDVDAIGSAIDRLLSNPVECQRLGKNGYAWAAEHDWARIVGQFIKAYEHCLTV